jgi:hypothetical protein
MNLTQFLERWPAKDSRLFLLAGRPEQDRSAIHATVADSWRKRVDPLDIESLHDPTLSGLLEACRRDPVVSSHRLVIVSDFKWPDPDEVSGEVEAARARRNWESFAGLLDGFPRDLVLVISSTHENPLTKNPVAQAIIRKGYWVVLKPVDIATASHLLQTLTGWEDEEILLEVVESVGTCPSDLIQFLKVFRLSGYEPTSENIRRFLTASPSGGVFAAVEAIIMRDLPRALSLAEEIPTGQLVGALERKFTSLLQFMAELRQGKTPKEAMLSLHLPGFIVSGLFDASKRWQTAEILQLFPTLAHASASGGQPAANDLLITRILS